MRNETTSGLLPEVTQSTGERLIRRIDSVLVDTQSMKRVCLTMTPSTIELTDEIGAALEAIEGRNPGRSHVIRLAVIALRKRMSDDDLLGESGT